MKPISSGRAREPWETNTMPIKILAHRSCIVSARLLKEALMEVTDFNVLVTTNPARIRGRFIRYGNGESVAIHDTDYNPASFIHLASNKSRFAKLMAQHKIYSPVYKRDTPTTFPVLIRKTLTGSGGDGIVVCSDANTFNQHWSPEYVWTPFVKTQFELRVHVLGGNMAKILKKVPMEGTTEKPLPIRNLDKGYHYSARALDNYPKVQDLVNKIHPLLNGAFYTLDLGYDKSKHTYFVFEVNSGSGLNTETVKLYAQYLGEQLSNT